MHLSFIYSAPVIIYSNFPFLLFFSSPVSDDGNKISEVQMEADHSSIETNDDVDTTDIKNADSPTIQVPSEKVKNKKIKEKKKTER